MTNYDTTKMTTDEIREILVEKYGYSHDTVNNIKGKKNLVQHLNDCQQAEEVQQVEKDLGISLDDIGGSVEVTDNQLVTNKQTDNDDNTETDIEEDPIPDPTSLEWTDYILSLLDDSEKFQGKPTVDGLRRIGAVLLGDYRSFLTELVQLPSEQNGYRASAICTIQTNGSNFFPSKHISGSADCNPQNAKYPYDQHLIAMAETRAEGRALRRALLIKTLVAEESANFQESFSQLEGMINDEQLNFLSVIGKRLDINIIECAKLHLKEFETPKKIKHNEAASLIQILNDYQRQVQQIPEKIRGYRPEWTNN